MDLAQRLGFRCSFVRKQPLEKRSLGLAPHDPPKKKHMAIPSSHARPLSLIKCVQINPHPLNPLERNGPQLISRVPLTVAPTAHQFRGPHVKFHDTSPSSCALASLRFCSRAHLIYNIHNMNVYPSHTHLYPYPGPHAGEMMNRVIGHIGTLLVNACDRSFAYFSSPEFRSDPGMRMHQKIPKAYVLQSQTGPTTDSVS